MGLSLQFDGIEAIREYEEEHPSVPAEALAKCYAGKLSDHRLKEFGVMFLESVFADLQRMRAKRVERAALRPVRWAKVQDNVSGIREMKPHVLVGISNSVVMTAHKWKKMLDVEIKLGDGTRVLYGDATSAQLRQRAAFLQRQRSGIDKTAQQLLDAANEIDAAGVTCLRELEEAAA